MLRTLRTLHTFRILCVVAAVLCFATGGRAQEYTSVVVFGDSLSDAGNIAQAQGLPAGTSFTTNPDPVWAEIVARSFGASGTASAAGGSNYAFGGACVHSDASCNYPVPRIGQQIDLYLSARPSGGADPDALYAVWGGGNDLETILQPNPGIAPMDPRAAVPAAAQALIDHVRRLRAAGARHVVVFNLPDLGATPLARLAGLADPAAPGAFTGFTKLYNETLDAGLGSLGDGIVPIDVFALADEAIRNPAAFGFTDVQGTACSPVGPNTNSLICGPAGSGSPLTYDPETSRDYLFADLLHPTGAVHEMIANMVTVTLAAPVQVSLAGEAGVEAVSAHRRALSADRMADFRLDRPVGSWRGHASGQFGRLEVDVPPRLGESRSDVRMATFGAIQRATENLWWGAALGFARHENGVSGATLDSETLIGSLQGTWRAGNLYLSGAAHLGRTAIDIARSIDLGPASRSEDGDTTAGQYGADLELGWTVMDVDASHHGLSVGVSWLVQDVDGYREEGSSSTAMSFSDFRRRSVVLRAGYRLSTVAEIADLSLHPHAGIAYERELEDEPVSVTAGSNTMSGRFTASGFAPPSHWVRADAGVSVTLDERSRAVIGYSRQIGSGNRADHLLSLGLRIHF